MADRKTEDWQKQFQRMQMKVAELERQVQFKTAENEEMVRNRQKKLIESREQASVSELTSKLYSMRREKERLLTSLEREEEYITNMLQKRLAELAREKGEMETVLEQEQDEMLASLTRQLAQAIADKLEIQRKVEASRRSHSHSDMDSSKGSESFEDSSMSSDSESGRELQEETVGRSVGKELELKRLRHKKKAAKGAMLKCNPHIDKALYDQLTLSQKRLLAEKGATMRLTESEAEPLTDRSTESMGSLSARSYTPSLSASEEIGTPDRSRPASITPRRQPS